MTTTPRSKTGNYGSPRPLAPWTEKIQQVLSDGEWHSVESVIRKAAPLVPPDRAMHWYRVALKSRWGRNGQNHRPSAVRAQDVHDQIRAGRREGLRRVINGLVRKGRYEYNTPERLAQPGEKMVRTVRRADASS